ncbi:MAG TPA: (2Fe-2S)-binding protein [Terriglobales bacterium]|nr:(2Fe-2S)-binding protein [Terriglobales bacterium]
MAALVLLVNGSQHRLDLPPDFPLLYALREHLQMTGTKYGCGEGQCGACTVLLEGRPVRSCRTPVSQAAGKKITTIEALGQHGQLNPVQQAFLDQEALQCGYCTPGMIMSAVGLLNSNPRPSDEEILRFMNGNMCRCGAYGRVLAAIRQAARNWKVERL